MQCYFFKDISGYYIEKAHAEYNKIGINYPF